MDDVDKLNNIQDGFIHYQLLRFCQATRLQYINGQITLTNQNVLHQQHVDHKIANALLKKGTLDIYKTWNQHDRAWVDMRLHESHDDGGFGVSSNTITRLAASYTISARFAAFIGTFACPAQQVWLPGNDLRQRQAGSPATQLPPRGLEAEPDSLLGVFKLSRPAAQPAHPHSHATPPHTAANQALGTLRPASAIRQHALR